MFGLQIKLVFAAIVVAAFVALAAVANHFHSAYVDATTKLATTELVLEATKKAAQDCSDNTQKMMDAASKKEEQVAKAQDQATLLAKTNKAMAAQILSQNSTNPNRCAAALDLIKQHKAKTQGK